jgi:CheY-like chemotaxis protein
MAAGRRGAQMATCRTAAIGRLGAVVVAHHVLVVDDDPEIRTVVADVLEMEACRVETAGNGAEALARIEASPPCLVLLDMRMPVMDGWQVAEQLRRRGLELPIVVMTAAQDARAWAEEIGADAVLAKPFELDELVATVTRFAPCPPPEDELPS